MCLIKQYKKHIFQIERLTMIELLMLYLMIKDKKHFYIYALTAVFVTIRELMIYDQVLLGVELPNALCIISVIIGTIVLFLIMCKWGKKNV